MVIFFYRFELFDNLTDFTCHRSKSLYGLKMQKTLSMLVLAHGLVSHWNRKKNMPTTPELPWLTLLIVVAHRKMRYLSLSYKFFPMPINLDVEHSFPYQNLKVFRYLSICYLEFDSLLARSFWCTEEIVVSQPRQIELKKPGLLPSLS